MARLPRLCHRGARKQCCNRNAGLDDLRDMPDIVVVQSDPFVLMDIHETIVRAYRHIPVSLAKLADLPAALGAIDTGAIVITSTDQKDIRAALDTLSPGHELALVLLGQSDEVSGSLPFPAVYVNRPFTTQQLLDGLTTASARLRSALS